LKDRQYFYIEDIKLILLKNENINKKYINKWLKEFQKTFPEKNFIKRFEEIVKASIEK